MNQPIGCLSLGASAVVSRQRERVEVNASGIIFSKYHKTRIFQKHQSCQGCHFQGLIDWRASENKSVYVKEGAVLFLVPLQDKMPYSARKSSINHLNTWSMSGNSICIKSVFIHSRLWIGPHDPYGCVKLPWGVLSGSLVELDHAVSCGCTRNSRCSLILKNQLCLWTYLGFLLYWSKDLHSQMFQTWE